MVDRSIIKPTECYRAEGIKLAETLDLREQVELAEAGLRAPLQNEIILVAPATLKQEWAQKIGPFKTAFASGWMQGRSSYGGGYSRVYEHGFVMSDHADWNDLNETIRQTGAKRVFVQHRSGALIRHLRKQGIEAHTSESLRFEDFDRLGGKTLDLFENAQV